MHGIQSHINVTGSWKKLLQRRKIKDSPQHLGIGIHRVHDLHWDTSRRNRAWVHTQITLACDSYISQQDLFKIMLKSSTDFKMLVWSELIVFHLKTWVLRSTVFYLWRAWKCPLQRSACQSWTNPPWALGRCDTPGGFCWSQRFCWWCPLEQVLQTK